jgi:hypothetical protein
MQVPLVTAHRVPGGQSMSEVQARFRQTLKKNKIHQNERGRGAERLMTLRRKYD